MEQYETSEKFTEREKVALRYTDVIVWDPTSAGLSCMLSSRRLRSSS
jgi:adenine-specific DNA methylase